jgi:hypothetical protein
MYCIPNYLLATFLALFITLNLISQFLTLSTSRLPSTPALSPDKPDKPKPHLHLSSHNTFNIAIISDLHYGENEATFGAEQDRKSTQVIGKILDFEEPDFVVISQFPPSCHVIIYC